MTTAMRVSSEWPLRSMVRSGFSIADKFFKVSRNIEMSTPLATYCVIRNKSCQAWGR